MVITDEFKTKVLTALECGREHFTGDDRQFARKLSLHPNDYAKLKNGKTIGVLSNPQWISLARELDINPNERKWNMARTDVFNVIEEDILFCQKYSKSKICADACGIGKTFAAKYLSRKLVNCFYVDASQAKTKQLFVRLIAKTIGLDHDKTYTKVVADVKYYLRILPNPLIIIDEAGDLDYAAFLELKELWNATEGVCGWYLIGADGLKAKIDRGITNKRVGYREIFSRYSDRYTTTVPSGKKERQNFYYKLIYDVLSVNISDKEQLKEILQRCLTLDINGEIGGLRRAESLLILTTQPVLL
jgi:hypothetical protein